MKKLTQDFLEEFDQAYLEDKTNAIIEGAISNVGVREANKNQRQINKHSLVFNHRMDHKYITDQKQTGRCWMFAALNMVRPKIMKDLGLEEFKLSGSYLHLYNNLEKTNVFLDMVCEAEDLDINSRGVTHTLNFKTNDGGYFEYFKALVEEYGLVPKSAMKESFNSQDSADIFARIEEVVEKYAMDIRRAPEANMDRPKEEYLAKVYTILAKCIGHPVQKFGFEYLDKSKNCHIEKSMTPQDFCHKYLNGFYGNLIRLVHDPRLGNPYGRVYINPEVKNPLKVDGLKDLSVPMDQMEKAMIQSLEDGQTAWFACDMGEMSDRKAGILDEKLYNYRESLVDPGDFSKAGRIDSRQSVATRAMNITGVNIQDGQSRLWKVENFWGEKNEKEGIFSMTDAWFDAYVYEFIVHRDYLDPDYLESLDQEPIRYSPYDAFCTAFGMVK